MANAADMLERAYELIESGDARSARELLDGIRSEQSDNPEFWWVYAHAVEDRAEGIKALDQLRVLDPDYPGLAMLSREVEQATVIQTPGSMPEQMRESARKDQEKPSGSGRSLPRLLAGAAIVVILLIAALLVIPQLLNPGPQVAVTPQTALSPIPILPTSIAADVTAEASSMDVTETVAEASTPETEDLTPEMNQPDLSMLLGELGVPENGVQQTTTSLGSTLLITLCTPLGPATSTAMGNIFDSLKAADYQPEPELSGIAFAVTDCITGAETAVIGTTLTSYTQFLAGAIDRQQLAQSLTRLN